LTTLQTMVWVSIPSAENFNFTTATGFPKHKNRTNR
jgi:hypothetical protein